MADAGNIEISESSPPTPVSGKTLKNCRKSMGYINNRRHLAQKYDRIFVRGHYLFREAHSFPRAKLQENCELRGTVNVQR